MKPLVVGSDSQVGRAFVSLLNAGTIPYECMSFADALAANLSSLEKTFRECQVSVVVNVDYLDGFEVDGWSQRELEQHHIQLPQQLAKLAEALSIPLLQLSDYQVFNGVSDKPYDEENAVNAQTLYGVTRWQGELAVQRFAHRHIILRTSTLFCEQGANVLTRLLTQWKRGEGYELSTRTQFAPTPVADVARVIYAILQQLECDAQAWGIYHYCSADITTPYDFAEVVLAAIAQFSDTAAAIKITAAQDESVQSKQKGRSGQATSVNQVLLCNKILNTFGICQRSWRGELTTMIENWQESLL